MHFIHRVLEESSIHINIIYYDGLPEPALIYFRKTQADIMCTEEISTPRFFASVKLPFEIKSAALAGRMFCMWTSCNFLVYCELARSLVFKEVARIDLCHFHPARSVLYPFGDAVVLVESQGARCLSVQRRELVISTKNKIVDVTFAKNLMHAIETDGYKSFLSIYEICVDMTLHRSTIEIEHTSYLIALGRRSSYVFFVGGLLIVRDGKVHNSIELPHETIKGCSFSMELSSLFVFTGDGCLSVISNDSCLESIENIGPVAGLLLFGRHLLTFGLQNRIYKIELNQKRLELMGDVGADQHIVLKRQSADEWAAKDDRAKRKMCMHEYYQALRVYRSHDSFLEIGLKHICVENRGVTPVLYRNRCPARSIFIGEKGIALLREGSILIYSMSSGILKAEKHEKVAADVSGILLFNDNSFLALHGGAWPNTFIMDGGLYVTYTENTVSWYLPGTDALKLVKHRKFDFKIGSLSVFKKFLVLHSGAVLWVFDCDLDDFVFVQILDGEIRGCFVENTFLYVLSKEAAVSIYKMDTCGRMELPIRIFLEERYATVKDSIVHAEKRVYLFVGYDFISVDTPKDTVDIRFHKNALYIHTCSSFCVFHVVLEECMNTVCMRNENKALIKYNVSSGMYVAATSTDYGRACGYKEPSRTDSDYRLDILSRNSGSTVHVYKGRDLVNYRDFRERVAFAVFCGKNVICALPFRCLVFVIGEKQLVAKSQIKLPSEICDMQEIGDDLYVKTRLHSVFKYSLSQNTLILVCSDVLNRKISAFKVLSDNLIVFSDMSGFIGVLEEKGHVYETRMSWYAGETVVHFRAEHHGIIYETADRKVGELICIESRLFSMLEAVYFHLCLKHHERHMVRHEYPVVNALPACFEMSGLIADNLSILGNSLATDFFRLCALIKLVYGSWMMKHVPH